MVGPRRPLRRSITPGTLLYPEQTFLLSAEQLTHAGRASDQQEE